MVKGASGHRPRAELSNKNGLSSRGRGFLRSAPTNVDYTPLREVRVVVMVEVVPNADMTLRIRSSRTLSSC
jgi:hypothetical protein